MQHVATIFGLGTGELVLIFLVVLLLFGGAKLPGLFRSAGQSVRELRKGLSGDETDTKQDHKTAAGKEQK